MLFRKIVVYIGNIFHMRLSENVIF